jgi:hypothetical protein
MLKSGQCGCAGRGMTRILRAGFEVKLVGSARVTPRVRVPRLQYGEKSVLQSPSARRYATTSGMRRKLARAAVCEFPSRDEAMKRYRNFFKGQTQSDMALTHSALTSRTSARTSRICGGPNRHPQEGV